MKKLYTIALILVLLIGLSLLLYPTVSSYINSLHQSKAISGYVENVTKLDKDKYADIINKAKEYNQQLANGNTVITKLTEEELKLYNQTLDAFGNGIMGYIEIPTISCNLPIYHGTQADVLQIAIGHIEGTSMPVGGANTHTVLSGHRGLPSARLFTDLDKLTVGDIFIINTLNETLTYEVYEILTVLPHEIEGLKIEENQDLCTLVTCTPYGVNSHRLFVKGKRVENTDSPENTVVRIIAEGVQIDPLIVASCIAIPALLLLMLFLLIKPKRN